MALDYNVIGARLKKARKQQKITQEVLAEKLDVSVAFISRIERGNSKINLRRLSQICNILGVSEGEILNGTSDVSNVYLANEFSQILDACTPEKQKLIYKIASLIANEE